MPTYNYACNACGHRFEVVQKIIDNPLTDCPECLQPALKKLISATSVVFKGAGWHRPDSKSSCYQEKDDAPPPTCGTGTCPSCALN